MIRRNRSRRFPPRVDALAAAFSSLGINYEWTPELVTTSGGNVTAWPARSGGVTLASVGTPSAAPTNVTSLGSQLAVPFTGVGRYTADIPVSGDEQTLIVVGRATAINGGLVSLTAAGAANTGSGILMQSNAWFATRLLVATGPVAATVPTSAVLLATLTTTGASLYVNSTTPGAASGASASFGQLTLTIGSLGGATFPLSGAIAYVGIATRVFNATERSVALNYLGKRYGQTIT